MRKGQRLPKMWHLRTLRQTACEVDGSNEGNKTVSKDGQEGKGESEGAKEVEAEKEEEMQARSRA